MPAQPVSGLLVPVNTTALPPGTDAEMDVPKSGTGKIALMITGIVGALGIGLGAAQYLNNADPKVQPRELYLLSKARLGPLTQQTVHQRRFPLRQMLAVIVPIKLA